MPRNADELIKRPDGSFIPYENLEPATQLEHDFVTQFCELALEKSRDLALFKQDGIAQMVATRQMLLEDHGVKKGGREGNLTLRSVCGRWMVRLTVSKHVSFGKELEAAKGLIDEIVEDELAKGASDFTAAVVHRVFSPNARGRIDTQGILNLREIECDDPRWRVAMDAIQKAVIRDSSSTYITFFKVDPHAEPKSKGEARIPLNIAEV